MQHIVSRGHTRPLTEISFVNDSTPDNTLLVSAAHDKLPQIRSGESGDWIGTFSGHKGAVWSAKVDRMTRTLALTASGDFTAKLWCATTGKELHEYKHRHVVKSIDFSNDTARFMTGCQDGNLRVFDTCKPDSPPLQLVHSNVDTGADPISRVHWGSEDRNDTVVIGRRSGFVELWDLRCATAETSKPVSKQQIGDGCTVMDIELGVNSDGCMYVAAGKKVSVLGADLSVVKSYSMPDSMNFREEGGVSLHPSGNTFMAGASDLWLREFDVKTGEVLRTFKGHHGPIRSVRYHPSGNTVASGSEDATIRLWKV